MNGRMMTAYGPDEGGNFEYRWQGPYLDIHMLTDVGRKRRQNEDSCLMCAPQADGDAGNGVLVAVADGMGGVKGGRLASRMALEALAERFTGANNGVEAPDYLRAAFDTANSRVHAEAKRNADLSGMGTTLSAVVIRGDQAYIGQVGDSRVYLARRHTPAVQLTDDHSLVAEQVREGFLSEEEARHHSLKNLITRAVGSKPTVDADLFSLRLRHQDTLLICSDGLSGVLEDADIDSAMRHQSLQASARSLVGQALDGGGPDNITVALVRITAAPPHRKTEKGAERLTPAGGSLLNRLRNLIP
jgi:protein phosphatase